jgi:hypothetical protein
MNIDRLGQWGFLLSHVPHDADERRCGQGVCMTRLPFLLRV